MNSNFVPEFRLLHTLQCSEHGFTYKELLKCERVCVCVCMSCVCVSCEAPTCFRLRRDTRSLGYVNPTFFGQGVDKEESPGRVSNQSRQVRHVIFRDSWVAPGPREISVYVHHPGLSRTPQTGDGVLRHDVLLTVLSATPDCPPRV